MLILRHLRKNAEKWKVQSPWICHNFAIIWDAGWYIPIITNYTKGGQKPLFLCQKRPEKPEKQRFYTILPTPAKWYPTHAFWRAFEHPLKGVFSCPLRPYFSPQKRLWIFNWVFNWIFKTRKKKARLPPLNTAKQCELTPILIYFRKSEMIHKLLKFSDVICIFGSKTA